MYNDPTVKKEINDVSQNILTLSFDSYAKNKIKGHKRKSAKHFFSFGRNPRILQGKLCWTKDLECNQGGE